MAKLTPVQFAEKHNRRTKAALDDMRTGIQNVTISPTMQAAAKADKMLARLTESVQSGKWADGLKRVTLEDWKEKMLTLGVNRVSQGLDANKAKVEKFATDLLPYIDSGLTRIKAMPDVSSEDAISRMTEWTRYMLKFRRK
jgi:molecular chaperone GrpE (heat shock protein)